MPSSQSPSPRFSTSAVGNASSQAKTIVNVVASPPQSPPSNNGIAKRRSAYLAALHPDAPAKALSAESASNAPKRAKSVVVRGTAKAADQSPLPVEEATRATPPTPTAALPVVQTHIQPSRQLSPHARFARLRYNCNENDLSWRAEGPKVSSESPLSVRPVNALAILSESARNTCNEDAQVGKQVETSQHQPTRRRMRTDGATPKDGEVMEVVTSSRLKAKKSGRKGAKNEVQEGEDKENLGVHADQPEVDGETEDVDIREEKQRLGHWHLGLALGSGANGIVKVSRSSASGRLAAIKVVSKLDMEPALSPQPAPNRYTQRDGERTNRMLNYLEREISIMRIVDHDNIVRLWDVYEDVSHMYLLLEYIEGGELFDYLTKRGRLSADETSYFFKQMVAGVGHLHQLNIVHRDLKPENILITRKFRIKVADFGLAAFQAGDLPLQSSCGSPHYAAPEVVSGKDYDGPAVDVWSVGIMLYACLMGRLPFDSDDELPELLRLIQKCQYYLPKNLPADVTDLITRMLRKRPSDRLTMAQINEHTFCKRNYVPTKADQKVMFGDSPCSCDEAEDVLEESQEIDMSIFAAMVPMLPHLTESHIMQALQSDQKTWEKVLYWHLSSEQASQKPVEGHSWSLVAPVFDVCTEDSWYRPSSDPGPSYLFARGVVKIAPAFRFVRTTVPRRARCRKRHRFARRVSSPRHSARVLRDFRSRSVQPDADHLRPGAISRLHGDRPIEASQLCRNTASAIDQTTREWVINHSSQQPGWQEDDGHRRLVVTSLPITKRSRAPHWTEQSARLQNLLITRRQAIIETMAVERRDTRTLYQPPEPSPWFHDREATATTAARRRWPFSPYSRPKGYDYTLPRTPLLLGFEGTPYNPKQHSQECIAREHDQEVIATAVQPDRQQLTIGEVLSPPPRPLSVGSSPSRQVRQLPPTPSFASPVTSVVASLAPSPVPASSFASPALDGLPVVRSPLPSPHVGIPARALPVVPAPYMSPDVRPPPQAISATPASTEVPSFTRGPLPLPPLPDTPASPAFASPSPAQVAYAGRADTPVSVYTQNTSYASPAAQATARFSTVSPRPSPAPAGPRSPRHRTQSPALTSAIPMVQLRRSLAVRPSNLPEIGSPRSPHTMYEPKGTPSIVSSVQTPKQMAHTPVLKVSPTPLVHPQPRRVYERPTAPLGGRTQVDKRSAVENSTETANENTDVLSQLLSPVVHDSPFKRPPPRQMQLNNRGPRPAPLKLQHTNSVLSPPSSAHSQLGSPLDTPSLSVIVTPALGFFDPSTPQPVLQELKGAIPRRGWMDKALGHKALYYELLSPQDTASTRAECRRVLAYLGAVVQVEDSEGWGNLKVHSSEIRDVSGVLIHKSVRLKIGFMPKAMGLIDPLNTRLPPTPRSAGYRPTSNPPSTVITVMMERGSADAFNAIYTRLKAEYGNETPRSIGPAYPSPYRTKPIQADVLVPKGMRGPLSPHLPEISSFDQKGRPGELFSAGELAYIHRA